ncbi:MAG: hypothetical protein PWR27_1751 [Petroclostridium sp.]|jgi:hypothetical protein|nr:hypothetical protein [Petroclostridium sp.]
MNGTGYIKGIKEGIKGYQRDGSFDISKEPSL